MAVQGRAEGGGGNYIIGKHTPVPKIFLQECSISNYIIGKTHSSPQKRFSSPVTEIISLAKQRPPPPGYIFDLEKLNVELRKWTKVK